MEAVDATTHYEIYATEETPSLLAVIIDTNPRAWAAIKNDLPISKALANIQLFVNSHLAYSNTNQVAIIASHTNRAVWLYPTPPEPSPQPTPPANKKVNGDGDDVEMLDPSDANASVKRRQEQKTQPRVTRLAAANKYPQFAHIESSILASLRSLMSSTTEAELATTTTQISGALTLALSHINKTSVLLNTSDAANASTVAAKNNGGSTANAAALGTTAGLLTGLHARILVVSVSDSNPAQYIPTMNAVFAASHAGIPIDILSLHGSATFLQQASYITRGTFLEATNPQGLLTYLLFGFASSIASQTSVETTAINTGGQGGGRGGGGSHAEGGGGEGGGAGLNQLVSASTASVDFRAACFCHRRVIDTGFVCSICLSIFCEVPEEAECLTCGTRLALGRYGARPAVAPRQRKKKKRKLGLNGEVGSEQPSSVAGTPRPG